MLQTNRHILYYEQSWYDNYEGRENLAYLKDFCGRRVGNLDSVNADADVYLMGHFENPEAVLDKIPTENTIYYIFTPDVKYQFQGNERVFFISPGEVPLSVHGLGVLYNSVFNRYPTHKFVTNCPTKDYFTAITAEHTFQNLTESDKPGHSHRNGVYITPVVGKDDGLHFNLLRCSTNLDGPTDNIRETDIEIVDRVNRIAAKHYDRPATLNHVLAQVYNNIVDENEKERRARIKPHSDKTKDMPTGDSDVLMAFCTFYEKFHPEVYQYDGKYKNGSVLTTLRFKRKACVSEEVGPATFDIVLKPNSLFLMSLETNRLYTHEIVPSDLPVRLLKRRLGYVIRSSATKAVHRDGETYIIRENDEQVPLNPNPTPEEVLALKTQYRDENRTENRTDYGFVQFSLNRGDYTSPIL